MACTLHLRLALLCTVYMPVLFGSCHDSGINVNEYMEVRHACMDYKLMDVDHNRNISILHKQR
jgi:hypothetical protein